MSHLTDMEELLARIENPHMSDYMKEAMHCYMAGAYRGCIVLSFIALFEDLLSKLGEMSKVNSDCKRIYGKALKLQEEQKVFERYLIDQLRKEDLVPDLDASTLDTIRACRNNAAHPTGHHPSAEEARFIFFTVIDRFLSKPLLRTTHLVEELGERMANKYFFTSDAVSSNVEIVRAEISELHDDALPVLLSMLLEKAAGNHRGQARNARRFILALAHMERDDIDAALQKRVIERHVDDGDFSMLLLSLLSVNAKLCKGLSPTTLTRLREIMADRTRELRGDSNPNKMDHPVRVLCNIHTALGEQSLCRLFGDEVSRALEKFPYISYFGPVLGGIKRFRDAYIGLLMDSAVSDEYEQANALAWALPELDDGLCKILSEREAFQLLVSVQKAAQNGAFGSQDLRQARFSSTPQLRRNARSYLETKPDKAVKDAGGPEVIERLRIEIFSET